MKTYTTTQSSGRLQVGILGIVALTIFIPTVLVERWMFGAFFGVILLLIPIIHMLRQVNEVRLHDDGTIEFRRFTGATRVNARDITSLVGVRRVDSYGNVEWSMQVWKRAEHITVPYFDDAWGFIDEVRARNPHVPVHGEWPMSYSGARGVDGVPDSRFPRSHA